MESEDIEQNEKESARTPLIASDSAPGKDGAAQRLAEHVVRIAFLTGEPVENVTRGISRALVEPVADSVEPVSDSSEAAGVAVELDDLGTYDTMFREYLQQQRHWIGAAQQPLVFHIRKLCRKLDADPDAPASLSSAYLQAIQRLDRQRPGNRQPAGSDGDLPGQGSIFDELD